MAFKPIVIDQGQLKQLPAGHTIDCGGWTLPSPTADNQLLVSNGLTTVGWKNAADMTDWLKVLAADATVYVRVTGNDSTGDGSSDGPYKTLTRAFQHVASLWPGDHLITVDIGQGIYTEAGTLAFMHPFGSQISWNGVSEELTSQSTSSIGSTDTLITTGLYYYTAAITLVGKSASVGDYILIKNASGGTNPDALCGCHKVSGWNSDTQATIQVAHRTGTAKASGTVSFDCILVKTVIRFVNKNGIKLNGPYHGGRWIDLVIEGDNSGGCDYAIWALNGAMIALNSTTGISGWQLGIMAQNNSMVFADGAFISRCHRNGIRATNGGVANIRWGTISGTYNSALYAVAGSSISAVDATIVGCGANTVLSDQGSFIDIHTANTLIRHCTNNVLVAQRKSIGRAATRHSPTPIAPSARSPVASSKSARSTTSSTSRETPTPNNSASRSTTATARSKRSSTLTTFTSATSASSNTSMAWTYPKNSSSSVARSVRRWSGARAIARYPSTSSHKSKMPRSASRPRKGSSTVSPKT